MPHFTLTIDEEYGALLKAVVSVSGNRRQILTLFEQPVPDPVVVRALVDTGASITFVDPNVLKQLDIQPRSKTTVRTPSTGSEHALMDEYDVCLSVYGSTSRERPCRISNLAVVESILEPMGFQVLLGRDFLSRCILHYNGMTGNYTLAF